MALPPRARAAFFCRLSRRPTVAPPAQIPGRPRARGGASRALPRSDPPPPHACAHAQPPGHTRGGGQPGHPTPTLSSVFAAVRKKKNAPALVGIAQVPGGPVAQGVVGGLLARRGRGRPRVRALQQLHGQPVPGGDQGGRGEGAWLAAGQQARVRRRRLHVRVPRLGGRGRAGGGVPGRRRRGGGRPDGGAGGPGGQGRAGCVGGREGGAHFVFCWLLRGRAGRRLLFVFRGWGFGEQRCVCVCVCVFLRQAAPGGGVCAG